MGTWGSSIFENDSAMDFLATIRHSKKGPEKKLGRAFIDFFTCEEDLRQGNNRTQIEPENIEALRSLYESGDSVIASFGIFAKDPQTGETIVIDTSIERTCISEIQIGCTAAAIIALAFGASIKYPESAKLKIGNLSKEKIQLMLGDAIRFIDHAITNDDFRESWNTQNDYLEWRSQLLEIREFLARQ